MLKFTLAYREYGLNVNAAIDFFILDLKVDEEMVGSIDYIRILLFMGCIFIYIFYRVIVFSTLIKVMKVISPRNEYVFVTMKSGKKYYNAEFISRNNDIIIITLEKSRSEIILFTNDISEIEFTKKQTYMNLII